MPPSSSYFHSEKLWGDDRIKHLELRYADMEKLHRHCEETGIEFMCTPFGVSELLFLKPMLKRVKIASGCITRKPLLEVARDTGLPIILSTGMSTQGRSMMR
jgi:sialic acid synthase SpsE